MASIITNDIVDTHTFWRTVWLWPCFLIGCYNMFNYDYFNTTMMYESSTSLQCIPPLFMSYLGWDMYQMMTNKSLFRTDLMTHHVFTFISFTFIQYSGVFKCGSLCMVAECISLFNTILKNQILYLNMYRLGTIMFVRMPIWIGFVITHSYHDTSDMCFIIHIFYKYATILFIIYDMLIISKIVKIMTNSNSNSSKQSTVSTLLSLFPQWLSNIHHYSIHFFTKIYKIDSLHRVD